MQNVQDARKTSLLDAKISSQDFKTAIPDLVSRDKVFSSWMYGFSFLLFIVGLLAALSYLRGDVVSHVYQRAEELTRRFWEFDVPDLAAKKVGVHRIAYLSNSHGTTGGNIGDHLRDLLERIEPGRYEVLNMAAAGMYSSEMLLRTASSGKYEVNAFIYATSYVSFADRMLLRNQAVRVRHFFRDGVPLSATLGFWLRNFDLPLFLDDAAATMFPAFRRRHENRLLWEPAVAQWLKRFMGSSTRIRALEVDYRRAWQFPSGFDGDLFNWRLLEGRRNRHMADFADALTVAKRGGASVAVFNMPVDFKKHYIPVDTADLREFQAALKEVAANANLFQDYQGQYPVEFTAYDPLHPNLHGARLHAFDIVSRLNEKGLLVRKYEPKDILFAFEMLGNERLESFTRDLARTRAELKVASTAPAWSWASFDLISPIFVPRWLANVATNYEDDPAKVKRIYELLVHFGHLQKSSHAEATINFAKALGASYYPAFLFERDLSQRANSLFLESIREITNQRHKIPGRTDERQHKDIKQHTYQVLRACGAIEMTESGAAGFQERRYAIQGDIFAVEGPAPNGVIIRRTDVLSDNGFMLLEAKADGNRWYLPYAHLCNQNGYIWEAVLTAPKDVAAK